MPRSGRTDSTLALLRQGYAFVGRECERYGADIFRTRFLLRDTICMRGEVVARLFDDEAKFSREGAAPHRVKASRLGEDGPEGLDDDLHRQRKRLFMQTVTDPCVLDLVRIVTQAWEAALDCWTRADEVVLFDAVEALLCRSVCRWAAIPLEEGAVARCAADLSAMAEGAEAVGPGHWQARMARKRAEAWMADLVHRVRTRELVVREHALLRSFALHRDLDGELLDERAAAAELLDVLRATVGVARFVTFAALALHEHPGAREAVGHADEDALDAFVHEVRRFYPFSPFVVARVRDSFEWNGHVFSEGTRVFLDLYGTNHDARLWGDPEVFRPQRFASRVSRAHHTEHRRPGESIAVEVMKLAVRLLTQSLAYDVPAQELGVPASRMPSLPKSRFRIRNVRRIG